MAAAEATAREWKKTPGAHTADRKGTERGGSTRPQAPGCSEPAAGSSASRSKGKAAPSPPAMGSRRDTPSHQHNELAHRAAGSRLRCSPGMHGSSGRAVGVSSGRAVPVRRPRGPRAPHAPGPAPEHCCARPAPAATTCGSPATTSAPRARAPLSHISGQSGRGARRAPPTPLAVRAVAEAPPGPRVRVPVTTFSWGW